MKLSQISKGDILFFTNRVAGPYNMNMRPSSGQLVEVLEVGVEHRYEATPGANGSYDQTKAAIAGVRVKAVPVDDEKVDERPFTCRTRQLWEVTETELEHYRERMQAEAREQHLRASQERDYQRLTAWAAVSPLSYATGTGGKVVLRIEDYLDLLELYYERMNGG